MSWFAHAVACSRYALGFGAYFEHVFTELNITIPHLAFFSPKKKLAAGAAVLFAYINFRRASETGKIGNLVTLAKIFILLIFIGFGLDIILRRGDWQATFRPYMPNGFGGVFKAMGLTCITIQGFEVIAQSSEEIKNPKKYYTRRNSISAAHYYCPGTFRDWVAHRFLDFNGYANGPWKRRRPTSYADRSFC